MLFFGLTSIVCWDLNFYFAWSSVVNDTFDPTKFYKPLSGIFAWLDKHLYHTGYNPKIHESFPEDNHFGSVFYITLFLMAILGCILWSTLDKKRPNYNRLFYWFNLYLRYVLAITMIGYGVVKFIPVQMQHPNIVSMNTPYGEQSLFKVLWNFMGMSPGYMMLTGGAEIVAALLLFSRRTAVFGYLVMTGILVDVVALNWFYNVPVKMFSAQLFAYSFYLVAPYLRTLSHFFFMGKPVAITQKHYVLQSARKKYSLVSVLVIIPVLYTVLVTIGDLKRYVRQHNDLKREKIYDVTAFIAKDTLPPLSTDTIRWKRLALFVYGNNAVVYNMKDKPDWYQCDVDSVDKVYTFHDGPDRKNWKFLKYYYPSKDVLQLTGKWKGKDIKVLMKATSPDSIPLNKEKIKLIGD